MVFLLEPGGNPGARTILRTRGKATRAATSSWPRSARVPNPAAERSSPRGEVAVAEAGGATLGAGLRMGPAMTGVNSAMIGAMTVAMTDAMDAMTVAMTGTGETERETTSGTGAERSTAIGGTATAGSVAVADYEIA